MQCRLFLRSLFVATLVLVNHGLCQTPIIGGICHLGTADVQIGGKHTQFFLKCEATSDSTSGEGVWVVKSRAASGTPTVGTSSTAGQPIPAENTQPQQHPKLMRKQNAPNICEQDLNARESDVCAVSATCLQADSEIPSSYLQCDQTLNRWIRKSCQDGFVFNFEQQTCVVPKRMSSLSHQCPDGSTSPPSLCPCPNGYLCTSLRYCCPFSSHNFCSYPCMPCSPSAKCGVAGAECAFSSDCPPSFLCADECCHLGVCPGGAVVLFTCTNMYQCGAGEFCLYGGCCPKRQAGVLEKNDKVSVRNVKDVSSVIDLAAEHDSFSSYGDAISESAYPVSVANLEEDAGNAPVSTTNQQNNNNNNKSTGTCVLDRRVEDCSMDNPCPEDSECISKQCCQLVERQRCKNGLMPLAVPDHCSESNECPIDSICERGTCCAIDRTLSDSPLDTMRPLLFDLPSPRKKSKSDNKSVDSNSTAKKFRCLVEHRCSVSRSLCPPDYTCTLHGRCCRLEVICPNGAVPEAMCSETTLCPSSTHTCISIDEKAKFCCTTGLPTSGGLVCTFSSCSNSNPCSTGTCNNGYCCSSTSAPSYATPICPGGGIPNGQCNSGYCSPGYSCQQNVCCPSYSPPRFQSFACPSGSPPVGGCINGACASGFACIQNQCCPSSVTKNPFVCPNGNQAAGGCVNGQCGTGYTCQNGLCCAGVSGGVKCLDGSEAVGACIPSCQGDGCGGVTITYYCGAGYTCTTGNICCPITSCPQGGVPIGPPVNGMCPQGSTLQGSLCCTVANLCADGSAGTPPVNGLCPAGTVLNGTVCCPSRAAALVGNCEVPSMGIGPCTPAGCGVGYACDNNPTNPQCCPVVNYRDPQFQIGPAVAGMCPVGYVAVYPPSSANPDGTNDGVCVDLQTVPGLCAVAMQSGPCNNGLCPPGFTCNTYADICCPTTTAFSRHKTGQSMLPSSYGRPLHSYMPQVLASARSEACDDGSSPAGGCLNGLCGVGHECQNGLCCPATPMGSGIRSICPNNEVAVSGCFPDGVCGSTFECVTSLNLCCPPGGNGVKPKATVSQETIRPIGARCVGDTECVGYSEGLSLCYAGVCQCSPIAYAQGIACVRRKRFKMNDSPIGGEEK